MSEPWDGIERRSGTKRRRKRKYRFIDRRRGFDRRKRYPVLGTMRDHMWLLVVVLVLLNVLSFVDGYFTAAELGLGIASEGNPVLAAASRQHPLFAVALKVGGMAVATVGFWHGRRRRFILGLSLLALGFFAGLVAYHYGTLVALGWL
ncbi:MAG: hypothetical protein JW940_15905 [Polyangiaceae bacterium]|nr:hypothetical protein [Polyangiaceae bacterium]